MDTENACRVVTKTYGDVIEGTVGALVPFEDQGMEFVEFEYVADGKIHVDSIPVCLLRQADRDEFKSFQSDMWDIYDRTNWN